MHFDVGLLYTIICINYIRIYSYIIYIMDGIEINGREFDSFYVTMKKLHVRRDD